MDNNSEDIISMLNTRGRVVRAKRWEIPLLKQQGMRVILNPKQEYYPEYDLENPRALPITEKLDDKPEAGELLEVDSV